MKDDIKRAIDRLTPDDAQREKMLMKILEEKPVIRRRPLWKPMVTLAAALILIVLVQQLPKFLSVGMKKDVASEAVAPQEPELMSEKAKITEGEQDFATEVKSADRTVDLFTPLDMEIPESLPVFSLPLLDGKVESEEKIREQLLATLRDVEKKLGLEESKISGSALDMQLHYEDGSFIHLTPEMLEIRKPARQMERAEMYRLWEHWMGWKSMEILKQDEMALWLIPTPADSKTKILSQLRELTELRREGEFSVLRQKLPFNLEAKDEVRLISVEEAAKTLGKTLPWTIVYREEETKLRPYYRFYDEKSGQDHFIPAAQEDLP